MADSDALRQRRRRFHAAGDHSLCRRCSAMRSGGDQPKLRAAGQPVSDAVAELQVLAGKLVVDYEADRGNAVVARELRLTLAELAKVEKPAGDLMGDLRGLLAEVS